jgi:hypothetical protein
VVCNVGSYLCSHSDGLLVQGQTLYSGKHPGNSMRIFYAEDVASNNADDTDAR